MSDHLLAAAERALFPDGWFQNPRGEVRLNPSGLNSPQGWWKPVDKPENYSPHTVVEDHPSMGRDMPIHLDDVGQDALRPAIDDWRSAAERELEVLRAENQVLRTLNEALVRQRDRAVQTIFAAQRALRNA